MSPFEADSVEPPLPRLPGTPIKLSEPLQQRFDSSGLATSAAGVARLALKYRAEPDPRSSRTLQMTKVQIAYFDARRFRELAQMFRERAWEARNINSRRNYWQ